MRWVISHILLLFVASQVYWFWRGWLLAKRHLRTTGTRLAASGAVFLVYALLFAYNFGAFGRGATPIRLTPAEALLGTPFLWWLPSSVVAFVVALLIYMVRGIAYAGRRLGQAIAARKEKPLPSPARRLFLERAATMATAAPFVAGAYGLLYGRLNLETPVQRTAFPNLPKAFDGFRIAQLSDIHIGPFMTWEQIRKFVAIANSLKPDMVVLTGDFVTFDPATQKPVVDALSALKAPFGIYGCLGNHDAWSGILDSIAELFRQGGVRILRHERLDIQTGGESFNLAGIDYQSRSPMGRNGAGVVSEWLLGAEALKVPDRVNILLSHNPDTFDRAAELGFDLSLAGHTHGGQAALEFISPNIAPSRIVTPYVAGWFHKPGGRLYVNRGIGTVGLPVRIGAPPEITVFELKRGIAGEERHDG